MLTLGRLETRLESLRHGGRQQRGAESREWTRERQTQPAPVPQELPERCEGGGGLAMLEKSSLNPVMAFNINLISFISTILGSMSG